VPKLPIVYDDVTGRDDVPEPAYPEIVAGYEALGYRQVARVLGLPREGMDEFLEDYAAEHQDMLREGMGRPGVVLVSPDGLVMLEVAWFYGFPTVTASTQMADGSLVETQRRWDDVPPWPQRAEKLRRRATISGEMRRAQTRGRRIHDVVSDDPEELDEAHRAHVEAAPSTPVPAPATSAEVVAELEHRLASAMTIADRFALAYKVASSVLAAVIVVGMLAVVFGTGSLLAIILGLVVFTAITPLVLPRLFWGLLYAEWYRPPYRGRT
jgi:hypothetical protein